MLINLKKIIGMVLCFSLMMFISSPVLASENEEFDEKAPEVVIHVYVNDYDEEYIKNIPFDDGTVVGDYDYSIEYETKMTRDPIYLPYFFDFYGWITRDGVVSLSLDPSDEVRSDASTKDAAWNILKDPSYGLAYSSYWPTATSNVETFKWQYDCHYSFANSKDYWNLEPHRTADNYLSVVLAGCNP